MSRHDSRRSGPKSPGQAPYVPSEARSRVDEPAGPAVARSYVTVFQALADLPLQAVAGGRCHDRFERRDGRWRFRERRARLTLVGDVSRHLRRAAGRP
ncbi:nuclear transport factor 2 family protein [Streptomyces sp. Edi4]|uniref:nuclear transport factor 2 family protein n=1 Tax=Streptomyces sp. Edi4 TaxID=3162527 RepID=UPI003305D8D0